MLYHVPLVKREHGKTSQYDSTSARQPLQLIMERTTDQYDPTSTADFSKHYTIEYNLKVHKIGRIEPNDMRLLSHYASESLSKSLDGNNAVDSPDSPA
ncbi:hypothetical protein F5B20DRAFT_538935 [Whalleya microplaca]|nr:hypothetical protein F5B20DRAFT_538935 [Whalleya microplaca]